MRERRDGGTGTSTLWKTGSHEEDYKGKLSSSQQSFQKRTSTTGKSGLKTWTKYQRENTCFWLVVISKSSDHWSVHGRDTPLRYLYPQDLRQATQ